MKRLACGCTLGWERCVECRPGLHADQETALAITMGEIAPDDWATKDNEAQRKALASHFWKITSVIDPWMRTEAGRLGVPLPTRSSTDADVYMAIIYGTTPALPPHERPTEGTGR